MINVLSMLFSVVLIKSTKKVIQRTFIEDEDDLHFDGLKNFQPIMILINLKNSIRMFQLICSKLMMRMCKQL